MTTEERRIEAVKLALELSGGHMVAEQVLSLAGDIDQFIANGAAPSDALQLGRDARGPDWKPFVS